MAEQAVPQNTAAELDGKVVIVTGAGHGLGRDYALHAAGEGAAVMVNDIDADAAEAVAAEITGKGGLAAWHGCSVASHEAAQELVAACVGQFGRLDGLVNNAGLRPEGAAWDESPADIRRAVEVNLLGTIFCGVAAMPHLREQRCGSIVNASSRAQRGIPSSATYAATKGAVASLTYSWAIDLRGSNVRVNAIAPQAQGTGTRRRSVLPGSDEPRPDQSAPLVTYLLSDRSRLVTGQIIRLGGRHDSLSVGLMTHPRNGTFLRRSDGWSVEALAAAFDTTFGPVLEPVGAESMPVAYRSVGGATVTVAREDSL